jgi:G:T-mismatch repair DNA endonuclease (very short patch repair protein)
LSTETINLLTGEPMIAIKSIKRSLSHIGNYHTKESKLKMSKSHKGHYTSEETRKKISDAHIGMSYGPLSKEHKQKISVFNKGRKHSKESKLKMSMIQRGKVRTEETKQKLKKIHNTEEVRQRHREAVAKRKYSNDISEGEFDIQDQLLKQGISFDTQKYIPGLLPEQYKYHKWDVVLEQYKTIIEHQGCYWHWCPICHSNIPPEPKSPQLISIIENIKKDKIMKEAAEKSGWKVIYIWEHTTKHCNLLFTL